MPTCARAAVGTPSAGALNGYRQQMADYLSAVGATRGLIVLMTEGRAIEVRPVAS